MLDRFSWTAHMSITNTRASYSGQSFLRDIYLFHLALAISFPAEQKKAIHDCSTSFNTAESETGTTME